MKKSLKNTGKAAWTPSSWRYKNISQSVMYENQESLEMVSLLDYKNL